MSDAAKTPSWKRRFLLLATGLPAFLLLFVVAVRITVMEMFHGIESSRATGLSTVTNWDASGLWSGSVRGPMRQKGATGNSWIARNADLETRSASFDRSVAALHRIVSAHHGFFEDLRTESRSGSGRALAAAVAVPFDEFDAALSDLETLGRVEAISQAGEDSAVKLATAARHLAAAQTNLSRLRKLQRERKGELRDAVALEKDIVQANEAVADAERLQESLDSTVAEAHIRVAIVEDYRAPLQVQIHNSLAEGIGGIFSTVALFLGALLSYGLPLLFWLALLFLPLRAIWRRFHHTRAETVSA